MSTLFLIGEDLEGSEWSEDYGYSEISEISENSETPGAYG